MGKLELYNLKDDISESNNLAVSNPEIVEKLQQELQAWRDGVGAQYPSANPNFEENIKN